jgi:TPP-dependent indolepyruvate ferredoxin oxidoreductase alpha subunit
MDIIMKRVMIIPNLCVSCVPCIVEEKCDMHATIRETPEDKPWVDFYKCAGCLRCKAYCPFSAIEEITQPCNGQGKMGW